MISKTVSSLAKFLSRLLSQERSRRRIPAGLWGRQSAVVAGAPEQMEPRTLLSALQTLAPVNGAVDVRTDTDLVLNFDDTVRKGTGNLVIKRLADNSVVDTLSVSSPAVTVAGSQVTVNLPADLAQTTQYFIQIAPTAIEDSAGNSVQGIDGPFFSWSFTTMTDLSVVPFWDGDASFPAPESATYNLMGGPVVSSANVIVSHETDTIRSGTGAIRADVLIGESNFGFFGPALAGFGASTSYRDTRDLTPYERMQFQFRNETGAPFTLRLELKDYRDLIGEGNSHRAATSFPIEAGSQWQSLSVPLDLTDSVWNVTGSPDLTQARQILFVIEAGSQTAVGGSLFVDEFNLVEPGGPLPLSSVSDQVLLQHLAERTFRSVWGSHDRSTGLVPAISTFPDQMNLNTTAMLVRLLPGAVDRQWVTPQQAETMVTTLVQTLNQVMDQSQFLPPRTLDRVSLEPIGLREESAVDAALLFLGLSTFEAMSGLDPALAGNIRTLLNRFDFRPFGSPSGWRFAFRYDPGARTGQLTDGMYDGYSGEVYVISLAAELAQTGHVDIATQFHSANSVLTDLNQGNAPYLVHPSPDFRSPFLQWLFPLFVDVQDRGPTTHPDPAKAVNPYENAVRYQRDVNAFFAAQGLPLQPDAADDGSGSRYITPSAFNDFSAPGLTMPWSSGFVLGADPAAAAAALRGYAESSLVGPFGPVDTAMFDTQSGDVTQFNGRSDLWNSLLWLSATVEYLYDDNRLLTVQPAVDAALDQVFTVSSSPPGDVDADQDFDANDAFLIHLVKLSGTDAQIDQSKGGSSLTAAAIRANIDNLSSADVDDDGDTDANDSFLIQLVKLSGTDVQIESSKGGSLLTAAQIRQNVERLGPIATGSSSAQSAPALSFVFAESPGETADSVIGPTSDADEPHKTWVTKQMTADTSFRDFFATEVSDHPVRFIPPVAVDSDGSATEFVWPEFRHWIDTI